MDSRLRWLRGLRCGFEVARLLGLQVRTQPEAWMLSLWSVLCCQVEVPASVRKTLTEIGTSESDL